MDAINQPLLDVRDLSVAFHQPAELRSRSTASPSRSSAASVWRGRRIRFRKIGQRAVDPQAAAVSDRVASVGQHSLQGRELLDLSEREIRGIRGNDIRSSSRNR